MAKQLRAAASMDEILTRNPKVWKLAEGFKFTEGPIWVPEKNSGYLLFSDPNSNTIYKYRDGDLSVLRTPSGYSGADVAQYGQPGSNGLTVDAQGRLTIDEHGNRRVSRIEKGGSVSVLASSYQGRRLNSPNDLVYKSDCSLYFTDPPFGLPKFFDDPHKELSYSGVYRWKGGLWIFSSEGKHLGTVKPPRHPHNMAWGDADGKSLYLTAQDRVYRMRFNIPGVRPAYLAQVC